MIVLFASAQAAVLNVDSSTDIQNLLSKMNPGDEVIFSDGTYEIEGSISLVALGTEAEPVIIRAEDGAAPEIVADKSGAVFNINKSSHLQIDGLTLRGAPDTWDKHGTTGINISDSTHVEVTNCEIVDLGSTGVRVYGVSSNIHLERLQIHGIHGSGIVMGCGDASCTVNDSVVLNNWVYDLGDWIEPKAGRRTGIYVGALSAGNQVLHNVVYRVGDAGIVTETTAGSPENTIEGNAVWTVSSPEATSTGIEARGAAVVRNNLVFDIGGYGIRANEGDNGPMENVVISHNTVVDTESAGLYLRGWGDKPGMVLANNVVANPLSDALVFSEDDKTPALDESNFLTMNIVTGDVSVSSETITLDDLVAGDQIIPGGGYTDFLSVETWDFYPADVDNSSLIDVGEASAEAWVPTIDFNGLAREDGEPDIGALEFYNTSRDTNPGWAVKEGFKELTSGVEDEEVAVSSGSGCCNNESAEAGGLFLMPLSMMAWFRRRQRRGIG